MSAEIDKFQNQYDEKQWTRLCANPAFIKARDAGEIVKAGEIADIIITGYEPNQKEPRLHI
jgi:hypothetical protein